MEQEPRYGMELLIEHQEGLKKSDLVMKNGRIKSKRASRSAKKNQNLKKAGWTFKKGEFGAVKIEDKEAATKEEDIKEEEIKASWIETQINT